MAQVLKHPPATQQMQVRSVSPHGRDLVIKQAKVEERAPGRRKGPLLGGSEEKALADSEEESIDSDKSINDRTMR